MRIMECLHTDSRCYKAAEPSSPIGIAVHSTRVNNPSLKRYVQPSKDDPNYNELIALIGKKATPGKAVVKQIYQLGKVRHPYLVKGSGVYGWVDEKDISAN